MDKFYGITTAVICFLLVTPFEKATEVAVGEEKIATVISGVIDTGVLGAGGIFPALVVAILSMIPMGATTLLFMGIRLLFQMTPYGTLSQCISLRAPRTLWT